MHDHSEDSEIPIYRSERAAAVLTVASSVSSYGRGVLRLTTLVDGTSQDYGPGDTLPSGLTAAAIVEHYLAGGDGLAGFAPPTEAGEELALRFLGRAV